MPIRRTTSGRQAVLPVAHTPVQSRTPVFGALAGLLLCFFVLNTYNGRAASTATPTSSSTSITATATPTHTTTTATASPTSSTAPQQQVYLPAVLQDERLVASPAPSATGAPTATRTATRTSTRTPTGSPLAATATRTSAPGCVNRGSASLVVTPAALPLQSVGTPFSDPAFCKTLRRVSGTSDNGAFETHVYSQLQAFSSDNAYILLTHTDGYRVRRVGNLSLVQGLDTSSWNAPRWYVPLQHTLIHYDDNADATLRVQLTNVDTLATTTLYTFPAQYQRIVAVQSSDELSRNGRWMAGVASRVDGSRVIFALDLQNLTLGAQLPITDLFTPTGPCQPDPTWGILEPDWVGVSPLGNYLMVQWVRDGTARCSGMESFNLTTGAFVGRVYDGHQHGDLGVDTDGSEFFMTFEMSHPDDTNRPGIGIRALPGNATVSQPRYLQLLDWGNAEHISCRGPAGVCLVTASFEPSNGWNPFEQELFLQYTDGRIDRLAHHRSSSCGYWVQPRASLSLDGQYAIFASDWDRQLDCNDLGRGDPYLLTLN